MTKAKVEAEAVTITRQQFKQFCESAVRGMRREHGDGNQLAHVTYWLCVGLHEGTRASKVLKQWAEVPGAIYDRETK